MLAIAAMASASRAELPLVDLANLGQYPKGPERYSVVSTRFTLAEIDKAETRPNKRAERVNDSSMTLDDSAATYVGAWVESTKQQALVGKSYRHDNNRGQGTKSAKFATTIIDEGDYEVRLIYVATDNRATNVPVTIRAADGDHQVMLNEREECMSGGVPRALGVFKFAAGSEAQVTITNKETNGFVVVDALQLVPVEIAKAQRATAGETLVAQPAKEEDKPGKDPRAIAVAVSPLTKEVKGRMTAPPSDEPVMLAKDAKPSEVNGQHYDLIVVGGTASGVACAVRAAREGCTVLLVQHNRHIGGMLANGLMQWDALYGAPRAPLFTELLGAIEKDAIARFGQDSKAHQIVRYTHEHYPVGWVEPHVMERECHRLIAAEKNLTLLLAHFPSAVEREGAMMKSVTLREYGTTKDIRVTADMFADATYEGDLFALAKVPYRVGREARDEYSEPHAGKIFVNIDHGAPQSVIEQKLNIRAYGSRQGSIDPTSPFTADKASQAYNYRFCVSKDPANRATLTEPPVNYNREEYVHYDRKSIATNAGPNLKSHMNSCILPGENHEYPEASWPEREKIIARHRDFGLGLIWFLQNDESVPEKQRAAFREWGLAKDEFPDNNHIPYEMYVREARRIVGRYVITEHDGSLSRNYARALIHADSIAVTDWYMDSHACTKDSRPGFRYDGKLILTDESRPMQIPYRALLPQGVDNLIVPVCMSATHVAWGALRLEPVWMQTGEAAGFAAALAKQSKTTLAALDADSLVRALVKRGQLVSFFNDVKVSATDEQIQAAEYFGTKGFFGDYDARLGEPVSDAVMKLWQEGFARIKAGTLDAPELARRVQSVANERAPQNAPKRGDVLMSFRWQP